MAEGDTTRSVSTAPVPTCRRRRWSRAVAVPALLAGAIVALEVARVYLLQSLHARGVAQGPLGALIGLSLVLMVPANYLVGVLLRMVPVGRVVLALDAWRVFLLVHFLFYFALLLLLGRVNRRINARIRRSQPRGEAVPTVDEAPAAVEDRPTRRSLIMGVKRTAVAGAAVAGAYPLLGEPYRLVVSRRSFPVRDLPAGLDGLRIVHVTDIHLGPWTSLARVRRIVETTNALAPEVVALTGDYVMRSPKYIPQVATALAGLKPTVGAVGVLGNHDWSEGGPVCIVELTRAGVRMIDNTRVFVSPARQLTDTPGGLCLAGVGDLWRDRQFYGQALGGVPPDVPRLLLSHNPDVAEDPDFLASGHRVDLMLSGHTHGGQVVLPFVGAPVTQSRYGQKYRSGLVQGPACPVFISRGLGMAMLPLRLGSVPEIAVIELRRAQ